MEPKDMREFDKW